MMPTLRELLEAQVYFRIRRLIVAGMSPGYIIDLVRRNHPITTFQSALALLTRSQQSLVATGVINRTPPHQIPNTGFPVDPGIVARQPYRGEGIIHQYTSVVLYNGPGIRSNSGITVTHYSVGPQTPDQIAQDAIAAAQFEMREHPDSPGGGSGADVTFKHERVIMAWQSE